MSPHAWRITERIDHMGRLNGKVAVITGGSEGMGRSTAKLFVQEGATVIITGRNQQTLDAAVQKIGGSIEAVRSDSLVLTDLDALKEAIEVKHGRVDILFANAGGARLGPFEQMTEEDYDYTFDTNAKGTFFTVQKLLPLMPNVDPSSSTRRSRGPMVSRTSVCIRRRRLRFARSRVPSRPISRTAVSV
jgi:NAD(P)-dependent dehydrogenase (short-subunit alcohol dehydrogenase family)